MTQSEIVFSGTPTYGNGSYAHVSSIAASTGTESVDMQRQIDAFVEENTTSDPPVIRTGRISGGFASDEVVQRPPNTPRTNNYRTNPREKRNESNNSGIDPNKTFFITEGDRQGGMRMSWETWEYVRQADGQIVKVALIFPSGRIVHLTGKDAYNFLKIVGDRNAEVFSRQRELN